MTGRLPALHPDPYDDAWREFCDALFDALGGRLPGRCQRHGASHFYAERLLEERGFDVEASIALYEKRGGLCDCEILANVHQPTLEDELEQLTDEIGEPIVHAVLDGQYAWIREHYGDEAAGCANYGWGTDWTEEPLVHYVATKVYGHGILSTTARRAGSGFEVTHEFTPFGSEADLDSKRRARREVAEWMRQRLEAGEFDTDPPGAPPGAKERVRQWLEKELEEPPA